MKLNRSARPPRRSAFTLIEIMVATAVMVILVGLVIQITNEVLKVWNRSSGKLSANSEARLAMEFLTQDLETAVFRDNGMQWLRVEGPVDAGDSYVDQTVALKLFAPALDRPKYETDSNGNRILDGNGDPVPIPGDICGIAYRLAFKEAYTNGPKIYALYRNIVDSKTTFNDLMGSGNQEVLTSGEWSESTVTDDSNYLVTNIVDFKVIVYHLDNSTVPASVKPFNAEISGDAWKIISAKDYIYGGNDPALISDAQVKPLYADIMLTMITNEGLEILQNMEAGRAGTGYDKPEDVVREHGQNFIRRIQFAGQGL
jgi:prepilin-type N-terminal cleavage/methylation domain-containing protein